MADQKDFVLPETPGKTGTEQPSGVTHIEIQGAMTGKEILLGSGIVIVGALLFFFMSRWFSDYLVKKHKSPTTARRAAWALFFFLIFTTALLVFGFFGGLWGNLLFIIPMGIFAVITLVIFIASAFSSR
jgi:fatty acid desaturase